jgi:hypothetical protein
MIHYYKRSLFVLFEKVQILRKNPLENRKLCLSIQETLIKKITYIEKRIRTLKENTKVCKRKLRTKRPLTSAKLESIQIKNRIKINQSHIKQYQSLLSIFKDIGDALAFIYIDKWDIKPMSFKQPSGFISGKKGSRLERKCLRGAFQMGRVALLNDLTHCLRHGDITVPKNGFLQVFEIKSGRWKNIREKRQANDLKNIYEYLLIDRTDKLYGLRGEMVRTPIHSDEVYHIKEINSLINDSISKGVAFDEVEKGLIYFVATRFEKDVLDKGINLAKKTPILEHLNQMNFLKLGGYHPFTLSIRDPEALYNFYDGKLQILVAVDPSIITEFFDKKGYDIKFLEKDYHNAMTISPKKSSTTESNVMFVGRHFFGRIFYEFLSLKWVLGELTYMMKSLSFLENEPLCV